MSQTQPSRRSQISLSEAGVIKAGGSDGILNTLWNIKRKESWMTPSESDTKP